MSIQQLKEEAAILSPAERRELIGHLIALGRESGTARPPSGRTADFLAWANRSTPARRPARCRTRYNLRRLIVADGPRPHRYELLSVPAGVDS